MKAIRLNSYFTTMLTLIVMGCISQQTLAGRDGGGSGLCESSFVNFTRDLLDDLEKYKISLPENMAVDDLRKTMSQVVPDSTNKELSNCYDKESVIACKIKNSNRLVISCPRWESPKLTLRDRRTTALHELFWWHSKKVNDKGSWVSASVIKKLSELEVDNPFKLPGFLESANFVKFEVVKGIDNKENCGLHVEADLVKGLLLATVADDALRRHCFSDTYLEVPPGKTFKFQCSTGTPVKCSNDSKKLEITFLPGGNFLLEKDGNQVGKYLFLSRGLPPSPKIFRGWYRFENYRPDSEDPAYRGESWGDACIRNVTNRAFKWTKERCAANSEDPTFCEENVDLTQTWQSDHLETVGSGPLAGHDRYYDCKAIVFVINRNP